MLLYFDDDSTAVGMLYGKGIVNLREDLLGRASLGLEANIDHRTDNLRDTTNILLIHYNFGYCFLL